MESEPILHTICAFANDFHNFGGGYIVVGVEENQGKPIYPPLGIDVAQLDKMQKDILNICSRLKPAYTPVVSVERFQNKDILIIWVPGGHARPYTAPATLGKIVSINFTLESFQPPLLLKMMNLKS